MHEDPPVRTDADRKGRVVVVVGGAKGDPAVSDLPDSLKKGEDETQPVRGGKPAFIIELLYVIISHGFTSSIKVFRSPLPRAAAKIF